MPAPPPRSRPDLASAELHEGLSAATRLFEALVPSFERIAQLLCPLIAARLGVKLRAEEVVAALYRSPGLDALEGFCGDWLGQWGDRLVSHRWEPIVTPPQELEVNGFELRRVQYAWVGDGFGYNYEVTRAASRVLLGAVFHLEPAPSDEVAYLTPHVGLAVARSRVVWLTPQHVFFEQVDPAGDRYGIAQYSWSGADTAMDLRWIYATRYHRPPLQ